MRKIEKSISAIKRVQRYLARLSVKPVLSVFVLAIILLAVGCSNTTATSTSAAAPTATPTTPKVTYPLTVTDILGRTVTLNQKPSRIVTVHPTATETLYRVGGTAIGRDTSSKYPPEAQPLPTVGSAYNPSAESVAALNPDLIIIEALSQAQLLSTFEKLGVPVLAVRAASLDDVNQSLTLVGKVIDMNAAAAQAITEIAGRIEAVKKTTRAGRSVLVIIGDANRNIYAAKPDSYPGALLALLGQKNLAEGMPDSGPYPGFTTYTGEQALTANPDAIFAISPAPAPAPKLSEMLPMVPGFNNLAVVKAGKVKELDPALFLQAQGPRIADAVEQMAAFLNEVAP
jgi:iron complex transport system substrate-binding protein